MRLQNQSLPSAIAHMRVVVMRDECTPVAIPKRRLFIHALAACSGYGADSSSLQGRCHPAGRQQCACCTLQYAELGEEVAAAGRVMLRRVMGKLAFFTLRDGSGDVQLYLDRSIMNEAEADSFR